MAIVKAFAGVRPKAELAKMVAARPYDVLNSSEARKEASGNPHSFLRVTKPEIDLPESVDLYDVSVYAKARENFDQFLAEGTLIKEATEAMYIYEITMPAGIATPHAVTQTGLVVCSAIDDYFNDVIKKHEYTRPQKEQDRIKHMATLEAHVGPVFMTYPDVSNIDKIIESEKQNNPVYDFTADDGISHKVWVIESKTAAAEIERLFAEEVPATYIADGHHRAASSAKVGAEKRAASSSHDPDAEYNYFLSVLFPASQMCIIDYNRVVKDLNGLMIEEFKVAVSKAFDLKEWSAPVSKPASMREFGMYLNGKWYKLVAKEGTYNDNDPIGCLDISVISDNLLEPILGIKDQRRDSRIDFVGGIRGIKELERRVDSGEMKVAFSIYPVSIQQLVDIADSGNVMPPKSTWFEPKLRSGLISHQF